MAVKILIKRRAPKERSDTLLFLLRQLRSLTMNQPGYISGETLRGVDKPDETLVISAWQSAEDWKRWAASRDRAELQGQIDDLLGEETKYEIYEY